jgi:hypothetical protein
LINFQLFSAIVGKEENEQGKIIIPMNTLKHCWKIGLLCLSLFIPQTVYADWLSRLQSHRSLAALPAVTENLAWSDGCVKHSRYMVKNNFIGHTEDSANLWYTPEGLAAAQSSNVVVSSGNLSDEVAVDTWIEGPFHAIGMLDPRLSQVGFGSYHENTSGYQTGACLDVIRGLGTSANGATFPVKYPNSGMSALVSSYTGGEFPDPLTSCSGYTAPTGPPIILQLGSGNVTPQVTVHSFSQGGTPLAHCVFDETSYTNANGSTQTLGRQVLGARDAIVLLPRSPLSPGLTYTASITANGQIHTWSFFGPGAGQGGTSIVPNDMNGDGRSDLVWWHSSGVLSLWLMNGGTLLQAPLGLGVLSVDQWEVVSTGDFNGDGRSDLVWRHNSGALSLWLMNGGALLQAPLSLGTLPVDQWEIVGTRDFNGDGRSDLVWRNSSGVTYLWLLNGGNLLQAPIGLGIMPSGQWEVVSTGDFNGDGRSDLVWRHISGVTYLWLLNGGTLLQSPIGLAVMPGSQWEVVSAGDFNGDGRNDLVWRHSSGVTYLWLLNGGTLLQSPIGLAVMPSSQWEVLTTGDFNGDGRSDLVWRHTSGVTYLWLINGGSLVQPPIGLGVLLPNQWEILSRN